MEEVYSQEIVDNIKHEPEVHFTLFLPDDPETDDEPEVKEVKIVLRKFDKTWKSSPELFKSYFACGKCGNASKQLQNLERHLIICKPLKKCQVCRLFSKSDKIIKCCFCDQEFMCKKCKSIHFSQVHRKDSNWHCSKCDHMTSKRECLRNHYQIHLKKFSCESCQQRFSFSHLLKEHQQQHRHGFYATQPEIKFECTICICSFASKGGLRQHKRVVHSKLKFQCDVCGKILKTKSELKQHIRSHFKVSCPVCHHLLTEYRLQRHIVKHTTTPRFKCDDCEKVYYTQNYLTSHKRLKHETEQVQCDLCQKIFNNKILLRSHMINHLKVSCPTCKKSMGKSYLNRHMNTHLPGR